MPIDIKNDSLDIAFKKLQARESILRQFEEIAGFSSWEIDLNTKKSIWSKHSYEIYGLKYGSDVNLDTFFSMVLPEYVSKAKQLLAEVIQTGKTRKLTVKLKRADGHIVDLLLNARVIYDEHKKPLKLIGTTQDITEISAIKEEARDLATLLEHSSNEIYIVDMESLDFLYVNEGASAALGYTKEELLHMNVRDISPFISTKEIKDLRKSLQDTKHAIARSIHKRKDGSTYPVQAYVHTLEYKHKQAYVIFDTDFSEIVRLEKEHKQQAELMEYQAHHDTLTRLPNRALFKDRLQQSIFTSKRHNTKFALLFIDLDQFKKINDSFGHDIGDEVLVETAQRFKHILREEDTLSRLGGDEFTIILKNIKTKKDIAQVAQKLINSMKKPLATKRHMLHISSSIGISTYPDDASTQNDLIKFADTAMYKAKEEGRNNFQFYSSEMTERAFERVVLENSLRVAVKEKQFEAYFQPQYDAQKETIVGMEALVRWIHPHVGIIAPGEFIPLAEESGLIIEIDKLVMQQAMEQFSQWYEKGYNPGVLALNLSMRQLNENNFITDLLETMDTYNFKASWLELEVTEGQVMSNPKQSIKKLSRLSKLGIEIAIDDFGTGYSSLSYLKKLPLSKLKIDQSFIRDIPKNEDDMAITKAIIALGKSLNLKLIAEGVETKEQRDFIVQNRCDCIQGYYYCKPINSKDITRLLEADRAQIQCNAIK